MDYEIRHGTLDDVPDLMDVWKQFTRHQQTHDVRYDHAEDAEDRWKQYYENQILGSKYGTVVVADAGKEIVGVAEARIRGGHPIFRLPDYGIITGHYVRKPYRDEGVSEAVLAAVHDWFEDAPRDISFYRANVLADDRYIQELFEDSDFETIELVYEKWLTER